MSEWKKVKIGEFLTESKVLAEESDAAHRITVRLNCKGVEKRGLKAEKEGATKYYTRYAGQFIYGKQNIHKGAFGIIPSELDGFTSSTDLPAFDIDESKCVPEWIPLCLKVDERYKTLQKEVKGVGSQRLAVNIFLNVEIPLPDVSVQRKVLAKVGKKITSIALLEDEIEKQNKYAKQLRQNILQEAIEGKLTADWRKQNPVQKGNPDYDAEALFEKIQIERNSEKKQKELSPITDEEKSFEIPEGWKWVRLGEISESCLGKMLDSAKNQGENRKYLRNLNVRWFSFDLSDVLEMKIKDDELNRCSARKGDLLICEGGYPGRSAIWNEDYDICFQKAVHRVRFYGLPNMPRLFNLFLFLLSESGDIENYLTGEGIKHLTGIKLKQIKLPLPPLKEQEEIVNKVETLLARVTELENQITEREQLTKQLMQSILKDTFEEK